MGKPVSGLQSNFDHLGCIWETVRPVIWLWLDVDGATAAENKSAFGTHVYFDNDHWKWHVIPRADVTTPLLNR